MVGPRSALHARDAQPVEPRRAVLPRRPRATRSITGYSGDTFPNFTPNPWFQRGVHVGRGRGRALVVPRVRAAARGRGARACPRSSTRSIAGSSMAANDGFTEVDTPFGRGRAARAAAARRRDPARAGRRPRRQRRGRSRRCSKGCGARSAARRGAIVTVEQIVDDLPAVRRISCASPRIASSRCARPRSARTPAGSSPATLPVDGLRRGLRLLGRGPRRDPARRLRRVDPALDPRARRPRTSTSNGSAPDRVARAAGQGRTRLVAGSTRPRTRPISTRPSNAWEHAAAYGARHLADRVAGDAARTRCSRAPASPNLAAWLGVAARARRGAATCSSPPRSGCGATSRWSATRSCSTTATSRPRRCSATRRWCSARLVGGPGTTTIGCLGGAQVDRAGNINSTLDPRRSVPRRHRVAATTWRRVAAENVVVATLTPQRTPADVRLRDVARARTCRRWSPTSARSRSRTASSSCARARARRGLVRRACERACAGGSSRGRGDALPELDPPTADEIAALAALGPARLVPPRARSPRRRTVTGTDRTNGGVERVRIVTLALAPRPTVWASADPRAVDLARRRRSPRSWCDELDDLTERRRAERLTLRQQPAGRVHRPAAADARVAGGEHRAPARPARTGRAPPTPSSSRAASVSWHSTTSTSSGPMPASAYASSRGERRSAA